MNYKLTIGLLGILIVLGAYLYFWESKSGPEGDEKASTEVLSFKAADINSIQVTYQGKSTELKKEESSWKLTKPEKAETEPYVVDGLVARIAPLNAVRVLAGTPEPMSTYGLETPQLTATIRTTGGKIAVLQVGDNTPDGYSFYAKRDDSDQIYVVSSSVISEVIKLVTDPPKALPTPTPSPPESPAPIGTPAG